MNTKNASDPPVCVNKPRMLIRNPHDVTVSWEKTFECQENINFWLQILTDIKEWITIYCGNKTKFRITDLAPCTCYSFRIRKETDDEWIEFKAATEDEGINYSVMHMSRAVKLGKASLIRRIAQTRPHLLAIENKENKSPLVQAVEIGDPYLVHLLITLGANVNVPLYYNKRTPLMIAVYNEQLQVAQLLIDKGADKAARDINGLTFLHYAVDSDLYDSVKFCLDVFFDIDCQDNSGWTPLMRAGIMGASDDIVNLLIEKGASLSTKDKLGFDFATHKRLNQDFVQSNYVKKYPEPI